jgi:hypothetical protein
VVLVSTSIPQTGSFSMVIVDNSPGYSPGV